MKYVLHTEILLALNFLSALPIFEIIFFRVGVVVVFLVILEKMHPISVPKGNGLRWIRVDVNMLY